MVGGVAALMGAMVVGPRNGRWERPEDFAPHNPALCVLGTLVLWFGWYGFNGASTLSMKSSADAFSAALVCMNTTLAPSAAGLVVFLLRAYVFSPKCFDVMAICNGILGGLVSITAGCGSVEPGESLVIGLIGAFFYQGASMLMVKLKIDDPLDAFAVHGACGFWGVLAAGLFGEGNGAFYGGDQLGVQIVAGLLIAAWVGIPSLLLCLALKKVGLLRASDEVQADGMDLHEHSPIHPAHKSKSNSVV
jgi:Amt family ammonium transporter